MKNNRKYLCFINNIGVDIEGNNIYEFLFTEDIDTFFPENGEYKPCGLCNDIIPTEDSFNLSKKIKTKIDLELIQNSTCFGYQDCIDNVVAIAYENIDNYTEYPEPFRIVLHYGDELEQVETMLAKRNILFK